MDIKNQCRAIYNEAFFDNDTYFEDKLFELCFKYCRFIKDSENVTSMLFLLPCELSWGENSEKCYYIFAAATALKYRNRGHFKKLLNGIKDTPSPLFLRPASENLITFYEKFGFTSIMANKSNNTPKITPIDDFKTLCDLFFETATNESYTAMLYGFKENPDKINFIYTLE